MMKFAVIDKCFQQKKQMQEGVRKASFSNPSMVLSGDFTIAHCASLDSTYTAGSTLFSLSVESVLKQIDYDTTNIYFRYLKSDLSTGIIGYPNPKIDSLIIYERSGSSISVYINNVLIGTETDVYTGNLTLVTFGLYPKNASGCNQDISYYSRIFNYALSADEVATLYNNGTPQEYVLPRIMKTATNKCIAEYLPQNVTSKYDAATQKMIGTEWHDSAKQLPIGDYLPPLKNGLSGDYNLTANGSPEIINKI